MSKHKKAAALLERAMDSNSLNELQDIVIFQDTDGLYQLFNYYIIEKKSLNDFVVTTKTSHTTHIFYTLKNAVTWCIFDKQNKVYESKRIITLDNQIGGLEVDLAIHKKLFEKAKNIEDKLIYVAKLGEDRIKKNAIADELHSYVVSSKNWQIKRFNKKPA